MYVVLHEKDVLQRNNFQKRTKIGKSSQTKILSQTYSAGSSFSIVPGLLAFLYRFKFYGFTDLRVLQLLTCFTDTTRWQNFNFLSQAIRAGTLEVHTPLQSARTNSNGISRVLSSIV
mgnify:FL=1